MPDLIQTIDLNIHVIRFPHIEGDNYKSWYVKIEYIWFGYDAIKPAQTRRHIKAQLGLNCCGFHSLFLLLHFSDIFFGKLKMNGHSSSRKRKRPSHFEDFYDSSSVEVAAPIKKVISRLCLIYLKF